MNKQIRKQDHGIQESKQAKFKGLVEQCMSSKKGKVLVVEDNTSVLMGIMAALSQKGMEVVSAVTKAEAIKALAENKDITLVITDVSYPERKGVDQDPESGLSFIRHVKDKRPGLKVIAQSSSNEYLKRAVEEGADDTVNKMDLMRSFAKMKSPSTKQESEAKQDSEQKSQGILLVSEIKGASKAIRFPGSEVEEANAHDAMHLLNDKSKYSKIVAIGDSKYASRVKHDMGYWMRNNPQVKVVFIQTDTEPIDCDGMKIMRQPLDASKISEAIGSKIEFGGPSKASKMEDRVLIVAGWDGYASTLEKTVSHFTSAKSDICDFNQFMSMDRSKYKKVILVDDNEGTGKRLRDLIMLDDLGRQPTPVIFLSWDCDDKPRENEVMLKQPLQLADLIGEIAK